MSARFPAAAIILIGALSTAHGQAGDAPISRESYERRCSLPAAKDASAPDWGLVAAKVGCSFRHHRPGYRYADEIVILPTSESAERTTWGRRLKQIRDIQEGCVFPCTRKEEVELYFGMFTLLGKDLEMRAPEVNSIKENYTEEHPVDVGGMPTPRVKAPGAANAAASGDLARRYMERLAKGGTDRAASTRAYARNLGDLLRSDPGGDDAHLTTGNAGGGTGGAASGSLSATGQVGAGQSLPGGLKKDSAAYAASLNTQELERRRGLTIRSDVPSPSPNGGDSGTGVGGVSTPGTSIKPGPYWEDPRIVSGESAHDAVQHAREPHIYLILVGPSYGGRSVDVDPKTKQEITTTSHEVGDRFERYAQQLQEQYETKDPGFRRGIDRAIIAQFLGLETFVRAWNRKYPGNLYKVDVLSHGSEDGIGAGGDAQGKNSKPDVTTADLRTLRLKTLEPGGMVVLWGCLTGSADTRYGRSFASELAEHLGAPVKATPGYDFYRSNLFSSGQDVGPSKLTGEWRYFYPPGAKPPPL